MNVFANLDPLWTNVDRRGSRRPRRSARVARDCAEDAMAPAPCSVADRHAAPHRGVPPDGLRARA